MKKIFSRLITMLLGVLAFSLNALAGPGRDASSILDAATTQVGNVTSQIINLVSLVGAVIGVIMLVPNLLKYLRGEPTSQDALMKVGAGLLIFVVVLQVINFTMLS